MNTFIQVLFRTDRSTDSTSMFIYEPLHKLPNIFLAEYLSDGLPISAPIRPSYAPVCVPVYAPGLPDRSQPIHSSACSANLDDVKLVSQQKGYVVGASPTCIKHLFLSYFQCTFSYLIKECIKCKMRHPSPYKRGSGHFGIFAKLSSGDFGR